MQEITLFVGFKYNSEWLIDVLKHLLNIRGVLEDSRQWVILRQINSLVIAFDINCSSFLLLYVYLFYLFTDSWTVIGIYS